MKKQLLINLRALGHRSMAGAKLLAVLGLLLVGSIEACADELTKEETKFLNSLETPDAGSRFATGHLLRFQGAELQAVSRGLKALVNQQLAQSRADFWSTYPDKPGHAQAKMELEAVLFSKDALLVDEVEGGRNQAANARKLLGMDDPPDPLTKALGLENVELDHRIRYGTKSFLPWARQVQKAERSLVEMLTIDYRDAFQMIARQEADMRKAYDAYRLERNCGEFFYQAPSLDLAFTNPQELLTAGVLDYWGLAQGRIRLAGWRKSLGQDVIDRVIKQVVAKLGGGPDVRDMLFKTIIDELGNELEKSNKLLAACLADMSLDTPAFPSVEAMLLQAEIYSGRYTQPDIDRVWREAVEESAAYKRKNGWPLFHVRPAWREIGARLGNALFPQASWVNEAERRFAVENRGEYGPELLYLAERLAATKRPADSERAQALSLLVATKGTTESSFQLVRAYVQAGNVEKAVGTLLAMDDKRWDIRYGSLEEERIPEDVMFRYAQRKMSRLVPIIVASNKWDEREYLRYYWSYEKCMRIIQELGNRGNFAAKNYLSPAASAEPGSDAGTQQVTSSLQIQQYEPPSYPYSAEISGKSGYVKARLTVNWLGRASVANIVASTDEDFTYAVKFKVDGKWIFKPRIRDGRLVQADVYLLVEFADRQVTMTLSEDESKLVPGSHTGPSVATVAPDRAPRMISAAFPGYPDELLKEAVKGTVIVEFVIMANGTVAEVKVAKSPRKEFEALATAAVKRCRFVAGEKEGKAVNVRVRLEVYFHPRKPQFPSGLQVLR